jgi:hypothetical protein
LTLTQRYTTDTQRFTQHFTRIAGYFAFAIRVSNGL